MFTHALAFAIAALGPCTVTDGDTIRCGDERIRITGIDAPETRACRRGRVCVEGDGEASTLALESVMLDAELEIIRLGEDRYGRTLGVVYANGVNIACAQLEAQQAWYVERWDDERLVEADCPALAASRAV